MTLITMMTKQMINDDKSTLNIHH